MIPLKMDYLLTCFASAKSLGAKYVGVAIQLPNAKGTEVIINSSENFDDKMNYYKNTYTDELNHKSVPDLKITGFTLGFSYEDIERALIG
jgi:3-oxoacyl-ACP reductase-like protein